MKLRSHKMVTLFAVVLLYNSAAVMAQTPAKTPAQKPVPPQANKGAKPPQAAATPGILLFAIDRYDADNTTANPVAFYNQGRFIDPMPKDGNEAGYAAFVKKYLRAGQKYRLISGGGDAGTIIVKGRSEAEIGLTASIELQTSIKLGGEVRALATNSEVIGRKQNSRRAPTPEERAAIVNLAKQTYKQKAVPAGFLAKMETINLTACDLDADGTTEFIGSFEAKGANDTAYCLFLIVESQNGVYKNGASWYMKGNEETYESRRFVDHIDIDGDGVSEVIAATSYYESTDYVIYKKVKGVWRSVYQGGEFGV
jgi:hypothetical protein